ncbi:hypothetical protein VTJ49DRAFT_2192 [Mycothermus thermophilus]|uniref:Acyltransferase MbtK/IucB-like conserved domain-containing protein n=1 Tax=Humicola insolens TaxID=85995 RepID=A0ABR3VAD9_HUMIN
MVSPTRPPRSFAAYAASSDPILKLPHPYQIAYHVQQQSTAADGTGWYHLVARDAEQQPAKCRPPLPESLLSTAALTFIEPADLPSSARPADANNTPWARARRNPAVTVRWSQGGNAAPTVAQLWLLVYAVFTVRPAEEAFRLHLDDAAGTSAKDRLARQLMAVGLAVPHPAAPTPPAGAAAAAAAAAADGETAGELLISRSAFWQGAGSPFGPRPAWAPEQHDADLIGLDLSTYPLPPPEYVASVAQSSSSLSAGPTDGTAKGALVWHPRRRAKPAPGSVLYSRWIPHLRETFSMVALDVRDETHVDLFHAWQNDPRVSQGWNLTGSREQHVEYLKRVDEDAHQVAVLARFDETYFAYFEVYWAKEDPIGAYYLAGDYDRGRHSLVGDVRYRGPHRVSAWWSSLMHYLFLDDPRTGSVVGEPKYTNTPVLMYDLIHGFGLEKFIDLPHKRSALVMGGTGLGLVPKL